MQITDQMAQERKHAEAVIDLAEKVVYAVEKADYEAADKAICIARMNLNALLVLTSTNGTA